MIVLFLLHANINFLLTEGSTGEYWPEVVAVVRSVRTKTTEGQYSPVRLELAVG